MKHYKPREVSKSYIVLVTLWHLYTNYGGLIGSLTHRIRRISYGDLGGIMTKSKWFKGNLHTHTTESDGDSDPDVVASWYAKHGYQFLVLTDHNHLTLLETPTDKRVDWPLLIPGEEVTLVQSGTVPVHLNAIGIKHVVEPVDADDVVSTLQANINAISEAGGMAEINHPGFKFAIDSDHLRQITGAHFLEIYNGHPLSNNLGVGGNVSPEGMWDIMLSEGRPIFGVAVDDAHHFTEEFNTSRSNPGRGWIVVNASECSQEAILDSLDRGAFYASTGINLLELEVTSSGLRVVVDTDDLLAYSTFFIGSNGTVLAESLVEESVYELGNSDKYVRAVVQASDGSRAWTQPVFAP